MRSSVHTNSSVYQAALMLPQLHLHLLSGTALHMQAAPPPVDHELQKSSRFIPGLIKGYTTLMDTPQAQRLERALRFADQDRTDDNLLNPFFSILRTFGTEVYAKFLHTLWSEDKGLLTLLIKFGVHTQSSTHMLPV